MKRKICVALLALSSGLMMVFAAEVDKCAEKFSECKEVCGNDKARCMARGNQVEYCNSRLNQCNGECNQALKTCQAKSQTKPTTSPSPSAPKKPGKK
jgi:hypothetical protein